MKTYQLYGGPWDGKDVAYQGGDYYVESAARRTGDNQHGYPAIIRHAALYTPAFHPYAKDPLTGEPKVVLVYRGDRAR